MLSQSEGQRWAKQSPTNTRRDMGKGETSCTVYIALKTNLATLEISMEDPKKLKWNILYDPAIPLLGTCPKDLTPYTTDIWSQSCSYLL